MQIKSAMTKTFFTQPLIVIFPQNGIGSNRNYYRIYFDFLPHLNQITRKGNIF